MHVNTIVKQLIYENDKLTATHDDKMRHTTRQFQELGILFSSYRGIRLGLVMHALGYFIRCAITANHSGRQKDSTLNINRRLFENTGFSYQSNMFKKALNPH